MSSKKRETSAINKRKIADSPDSRIKEKQPRVSEEVIKESFLQHRLAFINDWRGDIPELHFAAQFADLEVCQFLVKGGANVSDKCGNGKTPLHYAIKNKTCSFPIVEFLASKIVKERCDYWRSLIFIALDDQNYRTAELLSKLFDEENEYNLLRFCIKENNLNYAKSVHDFYPDLMEMRDGYGNDMILFAAKHAGKEMFRWLLEEADPSSDMWKKFVLHNAAVNMEHGAEIISFLSSKNIQLNYNAKNKVGKRPVMYALELENIGAAEELVERGAEIEFDWKDQPLLNYLVGIAKVKSVEFICEKIYREGSMGVDFGAIHVAAGVATLDQFRNLVEALGVECLRKRTRVYDRTVLDCAANNHEHGIEIIKYILEKDMQFQLLRLRSPLKGPLYYALGDENICIADYLRSKGAKKIDTNCVDDLLDKLMREGEMSTLYYIFDNNLVDAEVYQLIHAAAKFASRSREMRANFTVMKENCNFLQHCVKFGYVKSAKIVYEVDKQLMKKVDEDGRNMMHLAAQHAFLGLFLWVSQQCSGKKYKISVNKKTLATTLHYAALNKFYGREIIKHIHKSMGVAVDLFDANNETPLHYALRAELLTGVAHELLQCDANIRLKGKRGMNYLHFCVVEDKLNSAKFLLSKEKTLLREKTEDGRNALHLAAEFASRKMCDWLIDQGLDPNELTADGKSVLHFARDEDLKEYFCSLLVKDVRSTEDNA
ncbi:serine/threonine-protein phosphatase 6 regulatory ankyrin repeat subunit B-like [Cloeon dipterum]|uniref:serine/threonine-protein phosphatase 6 regulatory ankyrin repeat subunit B-like n=1 Tax=Cloeon dipterum TaxID=197152 RepID=UPI00322041C0